MGFARIYCLKTGFALTLGLIFHHAGASQCPVTLPARRDRALCLLPHGHPLNRCLGYACTAASQDPVPLVSVMLRLPLAIHRPPFAWAGRGAAGQAGGCQLEAAASVTEDPER